MAIGLAILAAFGAGRIQALSVVLTDQRARDAILPPALQGHGLHDPFVVAVLERWAAGQAAAILAWIFAIAAAVMLASIVPALALGRPPVSSPDSSARAWWSAGSPTDRPARR